MTINTKNLIDLTTPQYLLIAIVSPLSIYLVINAKFPSLEIVPIMVSMMLAILGFNTFNQISDIELDKIDKPLRPLISKKVTIKEATLLTVVFFSASLLIGAFINLIFFTLMLSFFLIAFAYCYKPIYLKRYFWASSVVGAIVYGIIPFVSIATISSKPFNIIFLLFFTSLAAIISNTKDFEDTLGEKKFGIKSIPLIFGSYKAAIFILIFECGLILGIGYLALQRYIEYKFIYASLISLLTFALTCDPFLKEIRKIKHKNIAFSETNNIKIKQIITQSDASTISMIFGLFIQIIFGLTSISTF
ncbi:MAG: hypothetical protein COT90_04260 [Candidatus Diapherotrites archaeon CG10_big_fil_rev_8_21_14_0_10_31_34]|nr:MAG: hypothetical protein COT90_04260 [Candidatus Diapherotrites archaeon CG10_big_fil_rev_8_21_14_0_10_31_34]